MPETILHTTPSTPTTCVLSWFDRHRLWLWLLLAVIYLAGLNGQWRPGPDSAIHLQTARSLAEGNGFTHPTGLHNNIKPGLAYLAATTFRVIGPDRFALINTLMLLCSAGALTGVYWLIRLRLNRPTAVVVTCMLAANETFFRYGYQVLTDMPFLLGLVMLLLGFELVIRGGRGRLAGIGLLAAGILVMAALRSVVLTVAAAGAAAVLWRIARGPTRWPYILTAAAGAMVILIVQLNDPRGNDGGWLFRDEARAVGVLNDQAASDTLHRIFLENGPKLLMEHLPESVFGVNFGPVVNLPLGLALVAVGVGLLRYRPLWGLLFAAFFLQWLIFITTERYMLVVMPLLALGWWGLCSGSASRLGPPAGRWVFVGLMALWFAPNLVRVGVFIAEQRASPFLAHYEDGRYLALTQVAEELNSITRPGDILIADHAPQLTWYTNLPVHGQATLSTYGNARDRSVKMLRQAERILIVYPVDAMLEERIQRLRFRELGQLLTIETPGYAPRPEHRVVHVRKRTIDWDRYRKNQALLNFSDTPGATQQSGGDTQQQAGERE